MAVSTGLLPAAEVIARRFSARTGHDVVVTAGASGRLYAQLVNGAGFDVFLSGDALRPARAEAAGMTVPGSSVSLGAGRLVLWSPEPELVDDDGRVLGPPLRVSRLVIADPVTSAHGAAAGAVLRGLGVTVGATSAVLVVADGAAVVATIRALTGTRAPGFDAPLPGTLPQAPGEPPASGPVMPPRAPVAGLVPVALVPDEAGGSRWVVPEDRHPSLEQQAVLLAGGLRSDAARAFMAFLRQQAVRDILAGFGYGPVGATATGQ